ncbi:hypothetical protein [Muribaculum intestinale]|uniref:hypothetical protein n=1 Tax=Muribaculum intestinale TaxID=1796646 RepID=UPI00242EBD6D|nr:hypothetical protein [Muribaculum intestinale]
MKTKRFDYNFRPLQMNVSFAVDGSVPGRQSYDADADEYTPDYTLTPLVIQPCISCMDKDGFLPAGSVNGGLANVRWYEIVGGVSTLIESTSTSYEITTGGAQAGRIKMKRNAQPKSPVTLEFHAEYVDPRNGQIHVIQRAYTVVCNNSTAHAPQLVLDAADQTIYNPLYDPDKQTVHASLRLGTKECPAENRVFVWEKFRADSNTWTEVGTDPAMDYDVEVSPDGASCIVDRSLMGSELYLRCRALYVPGGVPAEMRPNLLLDTATTVVSSGYNTAAYCPAGDIGLNPGDDFTCTIWGQLGEDRKEFAFYDNNGSVWLGNVRLVSPGVYRLIAKWSLTGYKGEESGNFSQIKIYAAPSTGTSESRIDRIKLEAGCNENPVWTPAANEGIGQYIELADSVPMKQIAFIRRIPKYEYDITGVPGNIPAGALTIAPEAAIWDANGSIQDPERELLPLWYIATNKPNGTLDYRLAAHGMSPVISTGAMDENHGAVVGLDVLDTGPLCAMEDTDGALFEDADGNIILIK